MTDENNVKTCKDNNVDTNPTEESQCVWYVNSPEHGNCFWAYIRDKSGPDGSMNELVQLDIAKLLGWSSTKTHFAMKQAMIELVEALKANNAHQFLQNGSEDPFLSSNEDLDIVSDYNDDRD